LSPSSRLTGPCKAAIVASGRQKAEYPLLLQYLRLRENISLFTLPYRAHCCTPSQINYNHQLITLQYVVLKNPTAARPDVQLLSPVYRKGAFSLMFSHSCREVDQPVGSGQQEHCFQLCSQPYFQLWTQQNFPVKYLSQAMFKLRCRSWEEFESWHLGNGEVESSCSHEQQGVGHRRTATQCKPHE
jgi:hypothetical protein